jgi:hypothetical protein
VVVFVLAGCVPQPKYNWGDYSATMIAMDEDPAGAPAYEAALAAIVNNPDKTVPPGIYAEYGYVLQEKGDTKDAAAMYAREKAAWPESAVLMDRMMSQLQAGKPVS